MISASVLIVDIDFTGGKCNLKMNITGEKGTNEKFIYISLMNFDLHFVERKKQNNLELTNE